MKNILKYLKSLNIKHEIYIPDRIKDGYGPNKKIFEKLIKNDNKLIITLDCGTLAFDSILFAKTNKIDTIIISSINFENEIFKNLRKINFKRKVEIFRLYNH